LFFLTSKKKKAIEELNTKFDAAIWQVIEARGEFEVSRILKWTGQKFAFCYIPTTFVENLGGRTDDHQNYVTAPNACTS
jgi:hypothetical protein